ncbi:guanylate kinase [Podila verticillata NRRL 6337]|nr:MAG: guanylate kinase [Podila humilis]KFH69562.1 guanylate kinase [Podila verticillata NRRL 6337]
MHRTLSGLLLNHTKTAVRRMADTTRSFTAQPRFPVDRRPIVLSGPSAGGKSTLIERLFHDHPSTFGFSVSHTTRGPRPGEKEGIAYHFTSKSEMLKKIAQGDFLEHAIFSDNMYGTTKQTVQDIKDSGKICILDIDLQGVRQIRASDLDARYIFIRPPNLQVLEQRLRGRGTETEQAIQKRLETARQDWEYGADPAHFDHVVVNDSVDKAYQDLCDYVFHGTKGSMKQ